jgi:ankyrin repeat protein
MTQFFEAIRAGDAASVRSQLDTDPALANAKNEQGVSALAFAVYNRKPEIAELLQSSGAQLDIFTACMTGNAAVVEEMLRGNKGLVKLMSADGWTPLHLAAFFGHAACASALLNAGADVKTRSTNAMQNLPLHAGAAGRNFEVMKMLVDFGSDVNARQHGGWAALHAASQTGDVAIAELLLASGADAKARANNNQSPMDLALTRGHQEIVELLEKYGVSL